MGPAGLAGPARRRGPARGLVRRCGLAVPGGRGMFGAAGVDLDPLVGLDDARKPLRSKLLAVPALRARYLGYVRDIARELARLEEARAARAQYQSLIADEVKADTRKLYSLDAFRADVDGFGAKPQELRRAAPRVPAEIARASFARRPLP